MGNVSHIQWTYTVILLCLCLGITFGHRFPYENPSNGYRNAPSKLNLRNFLGSKLIERLADNQNNEHHQYERYPPIPCDQMVHPPPPPPQSLPPPSYTRGVVPYEYQNQRMPPPPPPPPPPRHLMNPPPAHVMDPSPPIPMDQPPHLMGPPPQHVSQSNMHENVYTETITSSCPECEAANQDYSYDEEPCSCCEGCQCNCEDCSCPCKNRGRCPCYSDDPPYPPEKDYPNRDESYDDYPASDCPCCCCDCEGNHECPCSYPEEPPQYRRERPSHRGYPPVKQVNENYMEGPDSQIQRESYHSMVATSSYKPVPPPRELPQHRYQDYDEPMEPPQYVKLPPRRAFDMPPPPPPPPPAELPEEPMHCHHIPEPVGRVIQHTHMPEVSDRTIHHTEITERAMHRFHEPPPPVPMPPVDSRVSKWRTSGMLPPPPPPPPPPPRHIIEEPLHPEPPVPIYRKYKSSKRYLRKYRQPTKPPFFEGLSYTDGC